MVFVKIRTGLRDHYRLGKMTPGDLGIYTFLHLECDWETGVYRGTAATIAHKFNDVTLTRSIQESLRRLRDRGYIHYRKGVGQRGQYPMTLLKYIPAFGERSGSRLNDSNQTELPPTEKAPTNSRRRVAVESPWSGRRVAVRDPELDLDFDLELVPELPERAEDSAAKTAAKIKPESGVKVVRWSPTVLSGFMPLSEMAKRWETNIGDHTPEVVRQVCACLSDQTRERYRDYWPSRCTSAEKLVELFDQMYAEAAGVDGFSKYKPRWTLTPKLDCGKCLGTGARQRDEVHRGLRLGSCMCVVFRDELGRERTEYEYKHHCWELDDTDNIWPDDFPYATTRFEAAPAASAPSPKAGKKGLTQKEIYDLTTGKAR